MIDPTDKKGMVQRRWLVVLCPVVALVAVALVLHVRHTHHLLGVPLTSVDKATYVAANEAILHRVPVYPAAQRITTWSIGHTATGALNENGPPYASYTTTHVYRLPATTTPQQVLAYYARTLEPQGWRWRGRSGVGWITYARNRILLVIDANNGHLQLSLDHKLIAHET